MVRRVPERFLCGGRRFPEVFGPDGGPQIDAIPLEEAYATNLCFGGPDFDELFVTHSASGRVVSLPWRNPGQVLFPDR